MSEKNDRKESVSLEEAKRQVALVCRRLGLLHLAFAEVMVDVLGEEEGKKAVSRAIKEYSKKISREKKERALAQGLEPSPETFLRLSDLPSIGMHERIEEVEVEGEKRIRAHGCVMGRVWKEQGGDALGRIYCFVDPASAMEFDPRCKLVHTKAIPDGDEYCELVMRQTTENDRREFDSPDTDWLSIEGESD